MDIFLNRRLKKQILNSYHFQGLLCIMALTGVHLIYGYDKTLKSFARLHAERNQRFKT